MEGSTNTSNTSQYTCVSFQHQQFPETEPEMWFYQTEAKFKASGISADEIKFTYIVASLNFDAACAALEIMRNPPTNNKYDEIKDCLVRSFTDRHTKRVRYLIEDMGISLGNRTPSQLLHKLQVVNEGNISEKTLKILWLEQLPENTRAVLIKKEGNLEKLAELADKMHESESKKEPSVNAVGNNSSFYITDSSQNIEVPVDTGVELCTHNPDVNLHSENGAKIQTSDILFHESALETSTNKTVPITLTESTSKTTSTSNNQQSCTVSSLSTTKENPSHQAPNNTFLSSPNSPPSIEKPSTTAKQQQQNKLQIQTKRNLEIGNQQGQQQQVPQAEIKQEVTKPPIKRRKNAEKTPPPKEVHVADILSRTKPPIKRRKNAEKTPPPKEVHVADILSGTNKTQTEQSVAYTTREKSQKKDKELKSTTSQSKPSEVRNNAKQKPHINADLLQEPLVFVRGNQTKPPLSPSSEGPSRVLHRRRRFQNRHKWKTIYKKHPASYQKHPNSLQKHPLGIKIPATSSLEGGTVVTLASSSYRELVIEAPSQAMAR